MSDPYDDLPFGVIDGGKSADAPTQETVRNVVELDGVRLIYSGYNVVWELDSERWGGDDVPLETWPPYVAIVRLGITQRQAEIEPGEAARVIRDALRDYGALTRPRARILDRIPKTSDEFTAPVESIASIGYWMTRWWPALARAR